VKGLERIGTRRFIAALFLIAALYDGGLGVVFLLAPGRMYDLWNVPPPLHWGYVEFPAALLLIFALMFVAIARDPVRNRGLIIYGFLLKASYCGIVFRYWFSTGIPDMWKPFAVIDLIMGGLFLWSYWALSDSADAALERT
jgi:hypothetical protein